MLHVCQGCTGEQQPPVAETTRERRAVIPLCAVMAVALSGIVALLGMHCCCDVRVLDSEHGCGWVLLGSMQAAELPG